MVWASVVAFQEPRVVSVPICVPAGSASAVVPLDPWVVPAPVCVLGGTHVGLV